MKFRVDVDGESLTLDLRLKGAEWAYSLSGDREQAGAASIENVMPGVSSVLMDTCSYQVHVTPSASGFEVWVAGTRYLIALADPRDRATIIRPSGAVGPVEIRAHMPGKIVKLLADEGAKVEAGEGLIVVEAMKMQNEVKAPKAGLLTKVHVIEGTTVSAGDPLVRID